MLNLDVNAPKTRSNRSFKANAPVGTASKTVATTAHSSPTSDKFESKNPKKKVSTTYKVLAAIAVVTLVAANIYLAKKNGAKNADESVDSNFFLLESLFACLKR